jgi:hypothetical protein
MRLEVCEDFQDRISMRLIAMVGEFEGFKVVGGAVLA